MTVLNYTAKNKIVTTGFNVSGAVDISLLASDDSINSATTDLSGLLADQWVHLTGTAVDDGWHQLLLDSTANKITTKSTLTDETAGSAISITGYFHGLGEVYDLEFRSNVLNQSFNNIINNAESLSGLVETLFFREIELWQIATIELTDAEMLYWLEFLASVRAGESFSLDVYGTVAVPDNLIQCRLDGDPGISRISTLNLFTVSIKARVI